MCATVRWSGNERTIKEVRKTIVFLANGEGLSEKYRNHRLIGDMQDCFECHALPDWLLIYRKHEDILVLELIGTGSHSELFE
ncbi:MAG TPA: type II toxin-antitoxin system YafQ family toxin [Candidatus Magasanikbacteria bacterium]|nr:type II toxin-antitoxin system YafQ family toxin [Candidatus Magasanikbacteria bacterium]